MRQIQTEICEREGEGRSLSPISVSVSLLCISSRGSSMGMDTLESEVRHAGRGATPERQPTHDVQSYLVDSPEEGMFTVDRALFSDPELFELEMRYIFEGTWVYLAHESQV